MVENAILTPNQAKAPWMVVNETQVSNRNDNSEKQTWGHSRTQRYTDLIGAHMLRNGTGMDVKFLFPIIEPLHSY